MNPKLWWYVARATGVVAWALAAASVIWGLLLSTRSARGLAKPVWVLDLHRFLGVLALTALAAHLGALVADNFVHFGPADLLLPGASAWKTVPVAWGIVALWLLATVEVSSLVKARLPGRWWARIHLLSFVAYVLATLHFVQAGTERTNPVVLLTVEAVSAAVLFLTLLRILGPRRRTPRRSAPRQAKGLAKVRAAMFLRVAAGSSLAEATLDIARRRDPLRRSVDGTLGPSTMPSWAYSDDSGRSARRACPLPNTRLRSPGARR